MEKLKAIVSGFGFVFLFLVVIFGIGSVNKVKGTQSFWCLQKVVIVDRNIASDQLTTQTDLNKVFEENNFIIYPEDKISLSLPLNLCKGSLITIGRAPVINFKIGKTQSIVRSWAITVEELLDEKNITMGKDDKISPSLSTKLIDGMDVVLTHWGERIEKKEEPIAYDTKREPSADLVVGNTELQTQGKDGKKVVTYKITSLNGDDVSSEKIDEQIIVQPTTEVILYGTKPPTTWLADGQAKWYIDTDEMLAACNLVPRGTQLLVKNNSNGKWVQVTASGGNNGFSYPVVVDLSTAAFRELGVNLSQGIIYNVTVEIVN